MSLTNVGWCLTATESLKKIDCLSSGSDFQPTNNTVGLVCLAAQLAFEVAAYLQLQICSLITKFETLMEYCYLAD